MNPLLQIVKDDFFNPSTLLDIPRRSVCLVIPPSPFLLDERVFVSIGILKVAASLEYHGHTVSVMDLSGIENYLDPLADYLKNCDDFAIGITSTTPQLPSAIRCAQLVNQLRPDLRTILGGPHVTLVHSALRLENKKGFKGRARHAMKQLEHNFDVLVSGDGELAVFAALMDNPDKLIDGDDKNGPFFLNNSLYTKSPRPARHLVDMKSYRYSIAGHDATSLIAQLGCPFTCGFCGGRSSYSLRNIRTRTTASIVDEIEMLHKEYGYTGFMFYDDELNVNKKMIELMNEISNLQDRLGTEFRLRGFVKSELFNKEQAEAMYRAGFRWLLSGFEAANPRILENIQKRATIDDNTRAVETAKNAGLKVKALMSCGHPGETQQSIEEIADWLIQVEADDFDCTVITTYPGTPYYDLAVPNETLENVWTYTAHSGDKLHAYDVDYTKTADYYKGDPNDGYKSFVFTDELTSHEIVELRNWVEKTVRNSLDLSFNQARAALRYEHSMGQGLPDFIYRSRTKSNASEIAGSIPVNQSNFRDLTDNRNTLS